MTPRIPGRCCRRRAGFSLIEIMVVVVIIGLLAGAVALKVGSNVDKARVNRVKSDLAVIAQAVEAHRLNTGRVPTNREGLGVLDITSMNDPWDRPYQYNTPGPGGEAYEVVSYGADGRVGGQDQDADLSNWSVKDAGP